MDTNTNSSTIILPGYECQLDDDGLSHSRLKIESAVHDLISSGVAIDRNNIHQQPCLSINETINYRSTCAFQILTDSEGFLFYAMRSERTPKSLNGDHFPIATRRIQEVMKLVVKCLNLKSQDNPNGSDSGEIKFSFNRMRSNLSSVSFVSSWCNDMDCIATFNYCNPIFTNEKNQKILLTEAHAFFIKCNVTTLILRSKKMKRVIGRCPPYIDDVLHLNLSDDWIKVQLGRGDKACKSIVPVYYHKPEDAFQHPNGNTMNQALDWMLNKLKAIAGNQSSPMNLLEMYCGAGAHTIPISKTGIFDAIVAIELDQRLVDACEANSKTNGCEFEQNDSDYIGQLRNSFLKSTTIHVFGGDAGQWASKCLLTQQRNTLKSQASGMKVTSKLYWECQTFQVLLVDPPRAGLDENVCKLAINGSFEHVIYVSCGRKALIGDLKILSDYFEVADCTLTDLFPRTDSVETLVHLKRKKW